MDNLNTLLSEYKEFKAKADLFSKESRSLGDQIKACMRERGLESVELGGFRYECKTRTQSRVREDMLIEYLKERGLHDALSITTTVNEDVLVEYLKDGRITQEEVSQFIDVREINSIYIRKIRSDEEENKSWD